MYKPKDVIRSYELIYDNKLYEKFHMFNGLQNDVDIVYDNVMTFIKNNVENKNQKNIITPYNTVINNIKLSFCNLSIILEIEKYKGTDYHSLNAEYFNSDGIFGNDNIFNVKIGIYPSYAFLDQNFLDELKTVIAHELTHAYNDYRAKLNGKSLKYNINTIVLNNMLQLNKNSIEYCTASLTYALNKLEQQAVIGELFYDTKFNTIKMQSSKPVDIFKKTNTIKLLAKLYSFYKSLLQINPEYYYIVEKAFKQLTNKSISYNKIMKYFYKEILSFTNMCMHVSSTISYNLLKRLHECTDNLRIKYAFMKEDFKERSQKIINEHQTLYNLCLK